MAVGIFIFIVYFDIYDLMSHCYFLRIELDAHIAEPDGHGFGKVGPVQRIPVELTVTGRVMEDPVAARRVCMVSCLEDSVLFRFVVHKRVLRKPVPLLC